MWKRLLSMDMKTKVVQHVESEWMREWKSESVSVRECESERVTFEHRHENKSCSVWREWVNERLWEWESERVREWDLVPSFCLTFRHFFQSFKLSYQNKSCSECQRDVKKSVRQTDKQEDRQRARQTETDRMTDRQTDRQTDEKTDRLFSVGIKTKVVQNVNRMSKSQSDRQTNRKIDREPIFFSSSLRLWSMISSAISPIIGTLSIDSFFF